MSVVAHDVDTNPMLLDDEPTKSTWFVRRIFEKAALRYDALADLENAVNQRMADRLDFLRVAPQHILDVGSGTGEGARLLGTHYPLAYIMQVDIAHAMLVSSYQRGSTSFHKLSVKPWCVQADAHALPFANQSVDMVWSNLMLHWCHQPSKVMQEWHRVLKPNSALMFSVLGTKTLQELQNAFLQASIKWPAQLFTTLPALGEALSLLGFSDPVVDKEVIVLNYANMPAMMRGLRANGMRNLLQDSTDTLMNQKAWRKVFQQYEFLEKNGGWPVTYEIIYGHAWRTAPHDALYTLKTV